VSERVFIIGAGNVGRGLARAFRTAGTTVIGLHARSANEEATSVGDYPPGLSDANVIIIAVRDADIDTVGTSLMTLIQQHHGSIEHGAVVLHTSGTAEPTTFPSLREHGLATGTFHPLIPFATPERGAQLVKGAWFGIDGDAVACATARRLAAAVGARTVNIPPGQKAVYHAAAVMASNFPVVLAALASRLLSRRGIPERTADQVVQNLMYAAVGNLEFGSPLEVLTGPAARGETQTIQRHLNALRDDPEALAVYESLSQAVLALTSERGLPRDNTYVGGGRERKRRTGN
jgi:predicted short-subunit dehydrogenase-like oxidoreductase (DUF2520 family)